MDANGSHQGNQDGGNHPPSLNDSTSNLSDGNPWIAWVMILVLISIGVLMWIWPFTCIGFLGLFVLWFTFMFMKNAFKDVTWPWH